MLRKAILIMIVTMLSQAMVAMEIPEEENEQIYTYMNVDHLLEHNGKYLKQLIAIENSGVFSSDLVYTSGALKNADEEYIKKYSPKALQLGRYIAQRIDDLYKMKCAINKEDVTTIETLVQQNPYLINARGFTSGYECPLFMAVNAIKEQSVKKLLELKANPNMCDPQGNTPLHKPGTYNIAKMLIEHGADVDKKNEFKRTPLFSQIRSASLEMIKLLGERTKINKKDDKKNTVLHEAFKHGVAKDIVALLLQYGASLESPNYKGVTPFDQCCLCNYEKYSDLLEEKGYLYFSAVSSDYNPFALLRDNAECLIKLSQEPLGSSEWLVAKNSLLKLHAYMEASIDRTQQSRYRSASQCQVEGIWVNQHGCFLKNALIDDCRYFFGRDNIDRMYTILQERFAAENNLENAIKSKDRWSLKKIIKKYGVDEGYQYNLMQLSIACKNNDLSFYLKCGFDPDVREWGCNPLLFEAIEQDNVQALQLLLAAGADFSVQNVSRQTPLQCMEFLGHGKCITEWHSSLTQRFIQEWGKENHYGFCYKMIELLKNGVNVNVVSDKGKTALHYATQVQCAKCVDSLLEAKANIFIVNEIKYQPIHYALKYENSELVKKFIKAGAFINSICCMDSKFGGSRILGWALQRDDKGMIKFCLDEGAIVEKTMIWQATDPDTKKQLQKVYDDQLCCICYEHPDYIKDVPCANKHIDTFVCNKCCQQIDTCPICRKKLVI